MALKPKPVSGMPYTIVFGDTLSAIALRAFGVPSKWHSIWEANKTVLRSKNPHMIYPGEVIQIPPGALPKPLAGDKLIELPGKSRETCSLLIGGIEIPVSALSITKTMNTMTDAWTASVLFSDVPRIRKLLKPLQYKEADLYVGGVHHLKGILYDNENQFSQSDSTATLEGATSTADAMDSACPPPFELKKGTKLSKRAKDLLAPFGIDVFFSSDVDDKPFDKMTVGRTETIFEHLSKLAQERECIVSSTTMTVQDAANAGIKAGTVAAASTTGNPQVSFMRANTKGRVVASLVEGVYPFLSGGGTYKGRAKFSQYVTYHQTPGRQGKKRSKAPSTALALDMSVPRMRIQASEIHSSETTAKDAAAWASRKAQGSSFSCQIPLISWIDKEGFYWAPNTLVEITSPTLYLDSPTKMLITAVNYTMAASQLSCTLTVVLPSVYESVKELPKKTS